MRKFANVNLIRSLRQIMEHNTEHYQSEFDCDIAGLQNATRDSKGGRHFLWFSSGCGTWCFEERDVYIRNTHAFNTWDYYNHSSENAKVFAVEIKAGRRKILPEIFLNWTIWHILRVYVKITLMHRQFRWFSSIPMKVTAISANFTLTSITTGTASVSGTG